MADHPAILPDAARLEELRAEAAEARAECLLELGRPAEVAAAMLQLTVDHPLRERPVGLRMRALAHDGRHADALEAFHTFRRAIGDELGLEPSTELRALQGAILRHEQGSRRFARPWASRAIRSSAVTPTLRGSGGCCTTVASSPSPGPAGVGKTRLALHVAAAAAGLAYPDGVYLCELAGLSHAETVVAAVASTLRLGERAGRSLSDRVVEFLQVKRVLLVVDNCEHVRLAVASCSGRSWRGPRSSTCSRRAGNGWGSRASNAWSSGPSPLRRGTISRGHRWCS